MSGEGIFVSQRWNDVGVSQWTYWHPAYGVLIGEIDANGASSTRIHDDLGRLVRTASDAGSASTITRRARRVGSETAASTELMRDQAEFVRIGQQYDRAGGGASVEGDYAGSLKDTLAVAFEHGVTFSDLVGEKPAPGVASGAVVSDLVILPSFSWSMAVGRSMHAALDLAGDAWDAGNESEALYQSLRAAVDFVALNVTVAAESGVGAAVVLGAVVGGVEAGTIAAGGGPTRFINGVRVVDRRAGTVLEGTVDLKPMLTGSHPVGGSRIATTAPSSRTALCLDEPHRSFRPMRLATTASTSIPRPVSPVLGRSEWSSVRAARCSTRRTTTRRSFPCSECAP